MQRKIKVEFIDQAIDIENPKFAILHDLSDNRFKRLDISVRELVGSARTTQRRNCRSEKTRDWRNTLALSRIFRATMKN